MNFSILILISIFQLASAKPFWLSAKIESIQFKDGCLKNALCSQPRLQLIQEISPLSERTSISWPLSETTEGNKLQPFVSFFPSGLLEDVSLSASVVGVDKTYGFPRTCDQTTAARVFENNEKFDGTAKTMVISGTCFDAIITVTKHMERCPWCPDPADVLVSDEVPINPEALSAKINDLVDYFYSFGMWKSSQEKLQIVVFLLATFAIVITTAFLIIFVLYLKTNKNKNFEITVQPKPFESESEYSTITEYNMPWEIRKPYWIPTSTNSTVSTPLSNRSDYLFV